jgi:hypothetical protein
MSHVDPTREQFKAIFGLPLDRPVHMINLLRFREFAAYRDSDPEAGETPVTGAEAYRRYGTEAAPHFTKVGGKQLWIGAPELMLIGPEDERFDLLRCILSDGASLRRHAAQSRLPARNAPSHGGCCRQPPHPLRGFGERRRLQSEISYSCL